MIKNIKSYVINLEKYKNKYDLSIKRLSKLNLNIDRFNAISITDLNNKKVQKLVYPSVEYTIKYGRFSHNNIGSYGAIGCYLSHISLWKQLLKSNDEMYLIFEDDVNINNTISEFDNKLNEYLTHVYKEDWDIIFLGYIFLNNKIEFTYFNQVNDIIFGLQAYIINKKGAQKLLKSALPIVDQLDSYISYMAMMRNLNAYVPKYNFFIQDNISKTTIQTDYSIKPFINSFKDSSICLIVIIVNIVIFIFIYIFINKYILKS